VPKVEVEGYPAFDAAVDETLLAVCDARGIPMDSACGGFAACNSCRVVVLTGDDALSPLVDEEDAFLDGPRQRLGCQAKVRGDVRVRLCPGM
jgi:ferredoxin